MKIIGIAGYSGAGKTTLIEKLIGLYRTQGLSVATIKHAHHRFDVDRPGKDSFRHRAAGAGQVVVASDKRIAHMIEHPEPTEPDLPALVSMLQPCDLVLVESFKSAPHPKAEVWRTETGAPRLDPAQNVVALVTDQAGAQSQNGAPAGTAAESGSATPVFGINEPESWFMDLAALAVERDEFMRYFR